MGDVFKVCEQGRLLQTSKGAGEKMTRRSKVQQAFDSIVRETNAFCEEKGCVAVAVVEIEQLKTGETWHYCEAHAPAEADLPPRAVRIKYEVGTAVGVVQRFIDKHTKKVKL
jgi:hypothetical protein